MDFFGEQRIRTRRSLLLYGLFFLIVLAHIVVALAIMGLLLTVFTGGVYHWVLMLVGLLTLGSFIGGSFLEYRRLRAGGRAIAQRVGAVRLFIDNSQEPWEHSHGVAHQHETKEKVHYRSHHIAVRSERDLPPVYRRYYEIAHQLAIASGLSAPLLYVLPNEQGINGFVAGRHRQDMVLIVTQGALDKLSDEALYGLIGHEYGHILHGDATFNLQLMVVLAGLQILYDWSDPIPNTRYADNHNVSHKLLSQRHVDGRARNTEAQTTHFTTHSEWLEYWQTQSQQQQSLAKHQSRWVQNKPAMPHRAPRSVWTLLLHGLSFSSMASAQLIKHSFNRERELLADATSVQLTRSPAIIETLKAIHQDPIGSRLSGIADVNGLSHFFFASSGTDLGDVSWFATHPSLTERMNAINTDVYHDFAVQVAKEKRLNQQEIKEICRQRRLGGWGTTTANSLSDLSDKKTQKKHLPSNTKTKENRDTFNSKSNENNGQHDTDEGVTFTTEIDLIVDGRLQIKQTPIDNEILLKPWQAKSDSDLSANALIDISDMQRVSLPQYLLDHSHHPLGAQALIEAVMLCHQGRPISVDTRYGLANVWGKCAAVDSEPASHKLILPHNIDAKLLRTVANVDRRLDSAVIVFALQQLRRYDLSQANIEKLRLKSDREHSHESDQYYKKQAKCRTMLLRYQQGLLELFKQQIDFDLAQCVAHDIPDENISGDNSHVLPDCSDRSSAAQQKPPIPPILSLWQAVQLQKVLPVLSDVLDSHHTTIQALSSQRLKAGMEHISAQLDPSGQVFGALDPAQVSIVVLLAYRLSRDAKGQMISLHRRSLINESNEGVAHYIVDLRRHARLIDIDLMTVSDHNLHWLLLTSYHLNSVQLLVVISAAPTVARSHIASQLDTLGGSHCPDRQQNGHQIDYNDYNDSKRIKPAYNEYRQWLSTLHTVMLHDTIISQNEYDCLLAMSERWLGVRQLFLTAA